MNEAVAAVTAAALCLVVGATVSVEVDVDAVPSEVLSIANEARSVVESENVADVTTVDEVVDAVTVLVRVGLLDPV